MTLDRSLFTASFATVHFAGDYDSARHPRDAQGHFAHAFAGDANLQNLLKLGQKDPVARSAAADALEEQGRNEEANLLRHSKHPLVAIGGGVFEAPGITGEHGTQSLAITRGQIPRPALAIRTGDAVSSFQPTERGVGEKRQQRLRDVLDRIDRHQMTAEAGQLLTLTKKQTADLLAGVKASRKFYGIDSQSLRNARGTPGLAHGRVDERSPYTRRDAFDAMRIGNRMAFLGNEDYHATLGYVNSVRNVELSRRRGLSPAGPDLSVPHRDVRQLLSPSGAVMREAGWMYDGSTDSWLAPSSRHRDHLLAATRDHPAYSRE